MKISLRSPLIALIGLTLLGCRDQGTNPSTGTRFEGTVSLSAGSRAVLLETEGQRPTALSVDASGAALMEEASSSRYWVVNLERDLPVRMPLRIEYDAPVDAISLQVLEITDRDGLLTRPEESVLLYPR